MKQRMVFRKELLTLVTLIIGTTWFAQDAFALRQFRCQGRIQYRPCEIDESEPYRAFMRSTLGTGIPQVQDSRFPIRGPRYAKIVKSSFSKLTKATGLWSGVVKGNGLIETELHIYRHGNLESKRYMGHVWLQNKQTPFRMTSAIPTGGGWDWQVVAWAR